MKDGDQIVTGSYKVIRTLRNVAKVKVNNTVVTTTHVGKLAHGDCNTGPASSAARA